MFDVPLDHRLHLDLRDTSGATAERLDALARALPPGAAIGHLTAAYLHGFYLPMPDLRGKPLPLQVISPSHRHHVRRPGVQGFSADLDGDVVVLDGRPVTSPARTVLDIARYQAPASAIAMVDRALRLKLFLPEKLQPVITRLRGHRGINQARQLVGWADGGSESWGESATRLRVLEAGIPRPQTQIRVHRPGHDWPFRLDFGWKTMMVAVEYDGRDAHDPFATLHDQERRAWLAAQGWTIIVVTLGDVFGSSTALETGVANALNLPLSIPRRRW